MVNYEGKISALSLTEPVQFMLVRSGKNADGSTVVFDAKIGTIDPGMSSCFSDIYIDAALCGDGY